MSGFYDYASNYDKKHKFKIKEIFITVRFPVFPTVFLIVKMHQSDLKFIQIRSYTWLGSEFPVEKLSTEKETYTHTHTQ